jgi:DGQHR domain-containing protein
MNTKAVKFDVIATEQNGIRLFVGVARAEDLIEITKVDYYKPLLKPTDEKQGYQRPLERSRITRIGTYLTSQEGQVLFPTAVLLSARKELEYDPDNKTLTISKSNPLHIVDGQHRIEGLRYSIQEKGDQSLKDYPIPFVIMITSDRLIEMNQFRVVNGTAKQVRTDLVNMLLTIAYAGEKRSDIPKTDQWRIVASNVVDRLAKDPESPWRDMISLPGEPNILIDQRRKLVRATSFITSLRPVYTWLKETSGILDQSCRTLDEEADYMFRIVSAYWEAIKKVVPGAFENAGDYVIQKTPGMFSLHLLLRHLLGNIYIDRRKFDAETFLKLLKESPEIVDPDFWHKESSRASVYGSMKGFRELYEILSTPYMS